MGTATKVATLEILLLSGNISYPYGDSNRRRFFSSTLRHETFYPPMGTATTLGYSSIHRYSKHFIPLWGQQRGKLRRMGRIGGNISYPYGDSNLVRLQRGATPVAGNISYSYGDSNNVCGSTQIAVTKHFIPLWGQKENRYVQLDISVFTLFAIVIHILCRPYRARF